MKPSRSAIGPHVVGRYSSSGEKLSSATARERRGKGGSMEAGENQQQVSTGSHTPLEISQKRRDSHFPIMPTTVSVLKTKGKSKSQTLNPRRRPNGRITLFHKADRSRINKTGQLDLLTTANEWENKVSARSRARLGKGRGAAIIDSSAIIKWMPTITIRRLDETTGRGCAYVPPTMADPWKLRPARSCGWRWPGRRPARGIQVCRYS